MPQGSPAPELTDKIETQTIALMAVVTLLVVGAAWLLAGLLVPFFLAVVLAIALSPVATKLQHWGLPKTLASFLCLLFLLGVLSGTAALVLFQAGTVLRDSDRYVSRFSELLATVSKKTGADQFFDSLEVSDSEEPVKSSSAPKSGKGSPDRSSTGTGETSKGEGEKKSEAGVVGSESTKPTKHDPATEGTDETAPPSPRTKAKESGPGDKSSTGQNEDAKGVESWSRLLHRGIREGGGWVATGLGGLLGGIGGVVIFLGYFFYMLETRGEWIERITAALNRLGLRPTPGQLAKVQHEIVTYFGCLSLVALSYSVIVSLVLWALGVPQFMLWGMLAGLMEFVPYFGPMVASVAPTIVALSLEHWWQPALVALQYLGLHLVEGYIVTPLIYGKTIRFDPVTILFGALFFGWIWGPLGLALAVPMMVILRGLLAITPDTPALDALADMDEIKEPEGTAKPAPRA